MTWVIVGLVAWCLVPLPLAVLIGRRLKAADQRLFLGSVSSWEPLTGPPTTDETPGASPTDDRAPA
ncbi:hypothetical protein [Nocardioides sp. SYSU DS0663]|uniref:hypothetical protein n=1 Tax=Nocardioides sp. SYSU DS0663 TaxID=3416445 RepID=UPI003F4B9D3A